MGAIIRTRRAELGMTLQRLADLAGCAKSYLSQIENEHRASPPPLPDPPSPTPPPRPPRPREGLLRRLEEALGLPAGRLVGAARWQATPRQVRAAVERMQTNQRVARRLAEVLSPGASASEAGQQAEAARRSLDDLYRSGELKRLIEQLSPGAREGEADGDGGGSSGLSSLGAVLPVEVPLINSVAAGYPTEFTDLGYPARVADQYVRSPDISDPDAFAARVVGDSMLPDYREGDIVIFSPARTVKSGMDCFVRLEPDHETTFKRAYFEESAGGGQMIRLQPLNPEYAARTLAREQVAGLYAAVSVTRAV